jgi:competence protein ComEA
VTPAEQRALIFLAGVALLGAVARAPRPGAEPPPAPAESRAALARQIAAVDSARAAGGRARRGARRRGGAGAEPAAGARAPAPPNEPAAAPVDLDAADAAAIERLPRIGPTLARRIVADRDTHGAFGSLAALARVRGIGPGVSKSVART